MQYLQLFIISEREREKESIGIYCFLKCYKIFHLFRLWYFIVFDINFEYIQYYRCKFLMLKQYSLLNPLNLTLLKYFSMLNKNLTLKNKYSRICIL